MANFKKDVLFVRSEEADNNDPWDDTMLIRAYDAALAQAERTTRSASPDLMDAEPIPAASSTKVKWKKWDLCRAVYSVDGLTYEALILNIKGDKCLVKFKGYGNKETVPLSSLTKSKGSKAIRAQMEEAREMREGSECSETCSSRSRITSISSHGGLLPESMLPPAPPPPPPMFLKNGEAPAVNDAMHAMLMSWYMSGYHTGYYECLKRVESKN